LTRHERCARGSAKRACRVAIGKTGRAFGKLSQMRSVEKIGRAVRKEGAVQLVDHEDEDIRLFHCAEPLAGVETRKGGRRNVRLARLARQDQSPRLAFTASAPGSPLRVVTPASHLSIWSGWAFSHSLAAAGPSA